MPYIVALTADVATGFLSPDTLKVMGDAFKGISVDVNSGVALALPIALGIMGLYFSIRALVRFFKSVAV